MVCNKLIRGFDDRCTRSFGRWVQKAVLINYSDVVFQAVRNTTTHHCVEFALFSPDSRPAIPLSGYGFYAPELSDVITGDVEMNRQWGTITVYKHSISILINGVSENIKILQKQLDNGNFLGALKYSDGTIIIYGSETGLTANPYSYNDGNVLTFESKKEFSPPFVYAGDSIDFDNEWLTDIQIIHTLGQFNNDFNNDFKRHF